MSQKESEQTEEEMQIPLFSEKESEQTEEEMQIPSWFKINKPEFDKLTSNIYNNQNNKDFKITINDFTINIINDFTINYDLKKCKKNFGQK